MNKYLLDYRIKVAGLTRQEVADRLGIKRSTLYRKMNGITEFTQSEIEMLINILDIDDPKPIFFSS